MQASNRPTIRSATLLPLAALALASTPAAAQITERISGQGMEMPPAAVLRQQVLDYVAGMSDTFAMKTHDRLFRPSGLV